MKKKSIDTEHSCFQNQAAVFVRLRGRKKIFTIPSQDGIDTAD
jgi:hypothetical protein